MPNTASARANDHLLRHLTASVGYYAVAAAIGSDKTHVSRFLSDERPIFRSQLLHWTDAIAMRFHPADEHSEEGVLQELIDQASVSLQGIEQRKSDLSVDEVEALLKVPGKALYRQPHEGRSVIRTRPNIPGPLNADTAEQMYRNNTKKMVHYHLPTPQVCPCCKKPRSPRQFNGKSRFCEACRRTR